MRPHHKVGLLGLVAALAVGVAPAAQAGTDAAPAVRAVVVAQPGVDLPLSVPGARVVAVFDRLGSELVVASPAALSRLAADPRVAGVSPDRTGRMAGNDAGGSGASVLAAEALGGVAGRADTGKGVNVALLDTGVSDTAALNRASGRITDGVDVSALASGGDARTEGEFTDGYGHGTFLASLIAGGKVPGSGNRALGVAPSARIVVVKVADDQGRTTLSQVLAGMDWVAAHAQAPDGSQMIDVLNVALAVDRPTAPAYGADPLTAAVEHVRDAGVLVVAAAGNTPGEVGDPGLDPAALTVGAADTSFGATTVAPFSGSGVVAGVSKPDVVASGVHVLGLLPSSSTVSQEHPSGWQDNGLFRGSGTSEATAVTSGVAAAWYAAHPGASPADAKAALRKGATTVRDSRAGAGLVHLVAGNGRTTAADLGESSWDSGAWQANSWANGEWVDTLASSWSASSWSASSWSASSWSASTWSASSWSASSWSASSWSAYGWGADA